MGRYGSKRLLGCSLLVFDLTCVESARTHFVPVNELSKNRRAISALDCVFVPLAPRPENRIVEPHQQLAGRPITLRMEGINRYDVMAVFERTRLWVTSVGAVSMERRKVGQEFGRVALGGEVDRKRRHRHLAKGLKPDLVVLT